MTPPLTPEDRARLRAFEAPALTDDEASEVLSMATRLLDAYEALETNHQAAVTLLKAAGLIREDA